MNRFFDAVRRAPRAWLWSVIVLTVLTGLMVGRSGRCLKTSSAPCAIVSLELAWQQHDAVEIRDEWDSTFCSGGNVVSDAVVSMPDTGTARHMAKKNITDDIWFLMAYTLLFIVGVVRIDPSRFPGEAVKQRTRSLAVLALAAGALDGIENFFMWRFLEGEDIPSYAFAFPATVKFLFVLVLAAYILVYLLRKIFR